jgi:glyceraldehyde 3-phosphate dehydrogenase
LVSFQAYQFKYDSIHGRFNGLVEVEGDNLIIDGQVTYRLSKERRTVKHVNLIWA